jgi:hypothetical protein
MKKISSVLLAIELCHTATRETGSLCLIVWESDFCDGNGLGADFAFSVPLTDVESA